MAATERDVCDIGIAIVFGNESSKKNFKENDNIF